MVKEQSPVVLVVLMGDALFLPFAIVNLKSKGRLMSKKTVCVIGASGFVGSNVVEALLARGTRVHGTVRDLDDAKYDWVKTEVAAAAHDGGALVLHEARVEDKESLKAAMTGTDGVIVCAGVEKVEPETIKVMRALALNTCDAALELGIGSVVFTSSTGSTNPKEGEPEMKKEMEHWSDFAKQLTEGKFAAVAKTLLDTIVLAKAAASGGALRTATINPSLIAGPCKKPEPVNSMKMVAAILSGQRMGDAVPNGSMSMIDVRDLAALHIAALENEGASGRYFGVKASWHWRDILAALERVVPGYTMPEIDPDEVPIRPTQFDLTRRDSLGVEVRDLDAILEGVARELERRDMMPVFG